MRESQEAAHNVFINLLEDYEKLVLELGRCDAHIDANSELERKRLENRIVQQRSLVINMFKSVMLI